MLDKIKYETICKLNEQQTPTTTQVRANTLQIPHKTLEDD